MNKSPLKWMGSKKKLVEPILSLFPKAYNTYYEPFCGSAIIMFSLEPQNCICSDVAIEPSLVLNSIKNSYKELYNEFSNLANNLWENGEKYYYKIRSEYNSNKKNYSNIEQAAMFLFLLKSCFNGVVRFNPKDSSWNVPWGKRGYKNSENNTPLYTQGFLKELENYSIFLNSGNKQFIQSSFDKQINQAKENDLVYCDPPYISTTQKYGGWDNNSEKLLNECLISAHNRGVKFVLSNVYLYKGKENIYLKDYYKQFKFKFIDHQYIVGPKSHRRQNVQEVLIYNF